MYLSCEAYLNLAQRAKWLLTFGEVWEGYFVEPFYSGGVAFAVFNDRFFPPAFAQMEKRRIRERFRMGGRTREFLIVPNPGHEFPGGITAVVLTTYQFWQVDLLETSL